MNISFKRFLSLFIFISFSTAVINVNGFNRVAKYSYLATSGIKFPAIIESSYYDYKYSTDKSDEAKLKKLEYRALDAFLELSNEVVFSKLVGGGVNPVLLFDFVRLIKYTTNLIEVKRKLGGSITEKKDDLNNLNKDLEVYGMALDNVDVAGVAEELGLSDDEAIKLMKDYKSYEQDEEGDDIYLNEKRFKAKLKLILCVFFSVVESCVSLGVYGAGGDYLAKYKARQFARMAKLLRYAISSDSWLGKSGAVCICLLVLAETFLCLYSIGNNFVFHFNLPTIMSDGRLGETRIDINLGDSYRNILRSADGFSDLFVSTNDIDNRRFDECGTKRCPICLDDYKKNEGVYIPECCNYSFHRGCIEKAFNVNIRGRIDEDDVQNGIISRKVRNSPRCPMCRKENSRFSGPYKFK